MEFWLVCLGILAYSCQNTSRDSGVWTVTYRSQYHFSRHLTEGKFPPTAYCFSQPPQGIYLIRLNKSPAVVQKASNSACCRKETICESASIQRRNGKGFRAHLRVHSNSWYLGSCVIQKNLTVWAKRVWDFFECFEQLLKCLRITWFRN